MFSTNPDFASETRSKVFRYLVILLGSIFIGRLGQLQILEGSVYRSVSEAQAIKEEIVEPFRGIIYDRNGKLMVHNEASYTIAITPRDFLNEPGALPMLASILKTDEDEIMRKLEPFLKNDRHRPQKIYKDIGFELLAQIEEFHEYLPGVSIVVESKRLYNFDVSMAHLLGYTREISRDEYDTLRARALRDLKEKKVEYTSKMLDERVYYRQGDIIGKSGLEKSYEDVLRGSKGIKFIAVNRSGEKISSFNDGKSDSLVRNGFDTYLSIDKDLQEKAEKLMQDKRGAIVAMDPHSGEILAFVSKPDYDLRSFSGKVPTQVYYDLATDPGKPLYSRALQSGYPPGSTWKMLVALTGLQERQIDANSTFACPGSFTFGNRSYKCHGSHGTINVERAIQGSCNVFFYRLALKVGLPKLTEYAKMFGIGTLTGIDLPNERRGFFPTYDWVRRKFGLSAVPGRLVNYGIGQGEILVTPLQMAAYISAIANKGTYYQPHVVKYLYNNITNTYDTLKFLKRDIPIDKKNFDIVQKGMFDVVNVAGGTGCSMRIPGIEMCGKTGTAQNPHGKDHSWFVCFAPYNNPKIVVAVIVENAGFGIVAAAPVATQVVKDFFYPDRTKAPAGMFTSTVNESDGFMD